MAVVENGFVCDLSKPVQAQALKGNVFSLDNLGSRLSVLIYNNGQPATISGSITANCILPDESTVNINGSLTTENGGSKAYVDVPQSCLLIPGILKIAIKCTSSSVITTLAAVVANVYMTKTDNVITPSQQIIDDWNAEISAAIGTQDAKILAIETEIGNTTLPTTAQTLTGAIAEHETDIQTEITNRTNADNELKSAVNKIDGVEIAHFSDGYIKNNDSTVDISTIVPSPSGYPFVYAVMDCVAGDVFTITGKGATNARLWCFIDSNGNVLTVAGTNAQLTLGEITAPASASKLIIDSLVANNPFAIKGKTVQSQLLLCMRSGSTTLITTDAQATSLLSGDANNAEVNTIYGIGQTGLSILNLPEGQNYKNGNLLTIGFRTGNKNGKNQMYICYNNDIYIRSYVTNAWNDWTKVSDVSLVTNKMVNSDATAQTMFSADFNNLLPNRVYCIGTANLNISNMPFSGFAGTVMCMDFRETSSTAGRMQIAISNRNKLYTRINFGGSWKAWTAPADGEIEYHVGSTREYTGLVALLKDIQTDATPKVIYIDEGEYDIFQEYKDNNIPSPPSGVQSADYFDYNVFLPQNTRLVGIGNVVLKWNPSTSEITADESKTWSPLNLWYGNNTVENITILCKNGRYGIHDDSHNAHTGFTNKYKNVRVIYTQSDTGYGFNSTIGFGFEDKCVYEFDDCLFEFVGSGNHGVFYGHDGRYGGASIIVRNCVLLGGSDNNNRTIRLQSLRADDSNRILTMFSGCHVQGGIHLTQYDSSAGQFFDVTLLHSGNPTQTIDIGNDNPYPIKVYQ